MIILLIVHSLWSLALIILILIIIFCALMSTHCSDEQQGEHRRTMRSDPYQAWCRKRASDAVGLHQYWYKLNFVHFTLCLSYCGLRFGQLPEWTRICQVAEKRPKFFWTKKFRIANYIEQGKALNFTHPTKRLLWLLVVSSGMSAKFSTLLIKRRSVDAVSRSAASFSITGETEIMIQIPPLKCVYSKIGRKWN